MVRKVGRFNEKTTAVSWMILVNRRLRHCVFECHIADSTFKVEMPEQFTGDIYEQKEKNIIRDRDTECVCVYVLWVVAWRRYSYTLCGLLC